MGARERPRPDLCRASVRSRLAVRLPRPRADLRSCCSDGPDQVAYHRLLQLPYVPLLLSSLKDLFLSLYAPLVQNLVASLRSTSSDASSAALHELNKALEGWDKVWEKLLKRVEAEAGEAPGAVKVRPLLAAAACSRRALADTCPAAARRRRAVQLRKPFSRQSTPQPESPAKTEKKRAAKPAAPSPCVELGSPIASPAHAADPLPPPRARSGTTTPKKALGTPSKSTGSAAKVQRKWNDSAVTESDMAALDFSTPPPASTDGPDVNVDELVSSAAMGKRGQDGIYEVADYDTKPGPADDDSEMDDLISRALSKTALSSSASAAAAAGGTADAAGPAKTGAFTSLFSRLTGGKTLEKDDLRPVMDAMEKHLMAKNVAREVCEKVCEGVELRLVGKKLGALTSASCAPLAPLSLAVLLEANTLA